MTTTASDKVDFFVSYTGKDLAWAEWIAWQLEHRGYHVLIQAWDFKSGGVFPGDMHRALQQSTRVIAVLSPAYMESGFSQPEWQAAFADDPTGEKGTLVCVRVVDFKPDGLLRGRTYIDLVGISEVEGSKLLLTRLEQGRNKPAVAPKFPGSVTSAAPSFPGPAPSTADIPEVLKTSIPHNIPFLPNPFFTGRDKILVDLHTALRKKNTATITQPHTIHGLGGVGKTQLAVEYAWKYIADYDAILWVGVSTPVELRANIALLADLLKLPESAATQQDVKVQAVVNCLCQPQRWLLILDNADTKEAQDEVKKFLTTNLYAHVIVTSRLRDWPVGYEDLEVSTLPEPAAKKFLLKRARKDGFNPGNEADALAIAKELDFLPLALEQAGAYIAKHHISFAEYLKLWKESRANLLKFSSQGGTGYEKTVATTWLVSEQQLSLTARVILQMCAFLAPDNIPRALFTDCEAFIGEAVTELAKPISPKITSKQDIRNALAELADHSLIDLENEKFFSCHRLLQAALLDRLTNDERNKYSAKTLKLVNTFSPTMPQDVRTWPAWDVLVPHASSVLKEFAEQAGSEASRLMNQLGILFVTKALYTEAESMMRRALAIDEKNYGPEHPEVTTDLNNLAQLLQATNRLTEAESMMRRALLIDEKSNGLEQSKIATRLNNLALLLKETNRLIEAEPMMRRALAIDEKSYGPEHPNVATLLSNLAQLLQATNRLAEAEPMMCRALAIDEKNYGREHPNVASRLNNLAQLLKATNRLAEAEPMMRRALAIGEKSYGPEHPDVATLLSNLAQLLKATSRLAEAEPMMRRALAIDEKSYGPEHPDVARDLNNLARLLQDTNRLPEAVPMIRRALEILEKSYGAEHPSTKTARINLEAMQK